MVCYSSYVLNTEQIIWYLNGKKFGNQMVFGKKNKTLKIALENFES